MRRHHRRPVRFWHTPAVSRCVGVTPVPTLLGPSWPWAKHWTGWMGRDPDHRKRVLAAMREQYVRGDGIICTQAEWEANIRCYMGPLPSADAEAMVQMLTLSLARPASRTQRADHVKHFAAAIRSRHSLAHFERMCGRVEQARGRRASLPH